MSRTKDKLSGKDRVTAARMLRLAARRQRPTAAQLAYLRRGLDEPEGRLPLFNGQGQRFNERTIRSCIDQGWVEPWFDDPAEQHWTVCRLTASGVEVAGSGAGHSKPS